jgi:muramidase (phage lysozyme)
MARGGTPPAAKLLTLAAFAAFVFWPRRSVAAPAEELPLPTWGDDYWIENEMSNDSSDPQRLLNAFLFMIRTAEHDPRYADWQRYGLFYTSIPFYDFSDHPVNTKELAPIRLPDRLCAPAGIRPPCYSSAAGAYQIIKPTWNRVRKEGPWGPYLKDFSPENQDEAARRILIEAGVIGDVLAGNVQTAINKASRQWASLPGSTAMQNPKNLDRVLAVYEQGLSQYG